MREKVIFIFGLSIIILSSAAVGGEDFLSVYWERPIPAQTQNSKLKTQNLLHPESCGECHKEQYDGWKGSLHSKAVSPGLLGQLNPHKDPEFALSCYFCHAPMIEQSEVRSQWPAPTGIKRGSEVRIEKNKYFDKKLKPSGVSCSVCHLRKGKVYGPVKRKFKVQSSKFKVEEQKAHNFIEKDFFENAEFCAACHQLDEGYELNGKVLVNTYREWKESIYGKNNVICQNCHMPDRQHLWRGIHDTEMVKRGISFEVIRGKNNAKLIITNSGAGHYFPTYATPMVVVKGFVQDKDGNGIKSSIKEAFIGRNISLDISQEFYDTRIPPQKKFEFEYPVKKLYNGKKLVFEVWVYPDEFYNRFYKDIIKNKSIGINIKDIEKALKITEASPYMLYKNVIPL